jgi:hypothetical protein
VRPILKIQEVKTAAPNVRKTPQHRAAASAAPISCRTLIQRISGQLMRPTCRTLSKRVNTLLFEGAGDFDALCLQKVSAVRLSVI